MKKIGLIFLLALGFISAAFSQVNLSDYKIVWSEGSYLAPGEGVKDTVLSAFSDEDKMLGVSSSSIKFYGDAKTGVTLSGGNFVDEEIKGIRLPKILKFSNGISELSVQYIVVSSGLSVYLGQNESENVRVVTRNLKSTPFDYINAVNDVSFVNLGMVDNDLGQLAEIYATSTSKIRYWSDDDVFVIEWSDIEVRNWQGVAKQMSIQLQLYFNGDIRYAISSNASFNNEFKTSLLFALNKSNIYYPGVLSGKWSSSQTLPVSLSSTTRIVAGSGNWCFSLGSDYTNNMAISYTTEAVSVPGCTEPSGISFSTDLLAHLGDFDEDDFKNYIGKNPYAVVTSTACEAGLYTTGSLDSVLFVVSNAESGSFEFTPSNKTRYLIGETVSEGDGVVASRQVITYGVHRFDYFKMENLKPQTTYIVYAYPFNGNDEMCSEGPVYGAQQEVYRFTTLPAVPTVASIDTIAAGASINFNNYTGKVLVAMSENVLSQWSFGNPDTSVDYVAGQAFGEYAKVAYIGEVSDNQLELTFDKKANTAYSFRVWAYVENGSETLYSNGSASGKVYSPSTTIPVEFNPQPSLDPEGLYDYSMPLVGWGECEGFDVRSASDIGVLFNGQEEKVFYSSLNGDTAVLTTPWFSVDTTEFEIALNLGIFASNGAVSDLAEGDSIKVSYALKPADDGDTVWVAIDTLTTMAGLSASGYNEAIKEVFFHLTDLTASTELALRVEFSAKSAVLDGGEGSEDGEAKASVPANTYIAVVSNIRIQELTKCYAPAGIMTIDGSVTDASAQVRWNAALDFEGNKAESYLVLFQKNGAGKWDTLAPVADTMATFSALDAASTYKVQVSAVCGGENGISESRSTSFSTMWNIPDSVVLPEMGWQTFGSFKQYNYVDGKFVPQTNRWSTVFHSDYSGNNDVYAYVTVGDSTSLLAMNPVYKQEGLVRFDLRVTVHNSNEFTEDIKTLFSRDFRFKVMASHKGDFSDAIEIGSISRGDLALKSFKTFSIFAGQLTDSVGAYTFGLMYYEPEPVATVPAGIEFLFESYIASYAECETITDDTATDITYNSATLSWKSDLQYFQVAYGTEGKMDTVDVTEKQTLKLTKLLPETQYSYSILGFFDEDFAFACENSKVDGAFTTVAEPVEPAVCGVPTELVSVVDTVDAKAALSWKAGENNVSYELIWKAASAANFDTVEVKDSVYTLSDLEFNTAYVWSVRGVCEENVSDFATEVEFTTVEKTVSTENAVSAAIRVFAQDGMIHVLNAAMLNIDRVDVYTTTGSMVTSQRLGSTANVSIPVKGGRVLMVAVYSAGERAVYKVFVR